MKSIAFVFVLVILGFTLSGCVTCQECGSLKRSNDISRLFLKGEVVTGYSYYYSGPEQPPSAVMAIDSSYTVNAQFWKPVELAGEDLSAWLQRSVDWKGTGRSNKNGAAILDPGGKQVGIFFSKYDKLVTRFHSDNVVQVYPPSYQPGSGKSIDDDERH